ncbi:MAG: HD domain-containing protein [Candidatus Taylorbacteria bacterium]|nr:HD domain-containing protein [Candidatus Taylorbacteria bacterium]
MKNSFKIPKEVSHVTEGLEKSGFQAYLVGGCVRDLLIGREPKDWDVATDASPEEIVKTFEHTFYENDYGTVGVVSEDASSPRLKVIEVTPFRLESGYTDKRRPDSVTFSKKLEDDLKRRDFTINALALKIERKGETDSFTGSITDMFDGQKDLKNGLIRTVGNPHDRLSEDALRIMRAIRISAELGFGIEKGTLEALKTHANLLGHIAKERIREEFVRILMSDVPMNALIMSRELGVIPYIAKELEESYDIEQNMAHAYDVWEHLLRTVQHAADKKYPLEIRIAALFHDIGKPRTRRVSRETKYTFYGHEVVGAKMTEKILKNLNFSRETVDYVVKLVRWHMFFSDTEQITLSAVRRMIANVGKERIWDLMNVRICDRIGTGRPKENPYRLRKYKAMVEEALRDPISVGMLKIDGKKVMEIGKMAPGPKVGLILNALMEEVLDDPKKNTDEYLSTRTKELNELDLPTLSKLAAVGKEKKMKAEEEELAKIRNKHKVK